MNVLENLSLATLKEMMGLGPCLYCVLCSCKLDFESFLILALHYLPKDKLCIYPRKMFLEGFFCTLLGMTLVKIYVTSLLFPLTASLPISSIMFMRLPILRLYLCTRVVNIVPITLQLIR